MTWSDEKAVVSDELRRLVLLTFVFYGLLGVGAFAACQQEREAELAPAGGRADRGGAGVPGGCRVRPRFRHLSLRRAVIMPSTARSSRAEVRNPVLALPAMLALRDLPAEQRAALELLLRDLARDAQARADECWRKHKAPMAAYWKAVAVYARHVARALGPPKIVWGD